MPLGRYLFFVMHVYFVRHGETDLNRRLVHQSPGTPLNEKGFEQARSVGEVLRPMNATLLVASTYERASQTARAIGQCIGHTPKYSALFREVERPSNLAEVSFFSLKSVWYVFLSIIHRNNSQWRYKDAESFFDIYARIQETFAYIESLIEAHESIIIVSHSEYISLMLSYMCHDKKLTFTELVRALLSINQIKNCAVTHVEFVGPTAKGTCGWMKRDSNF